MSIKFFKDINENDNVGGKGFSLAKMIQNGFNIPDGFVIKAELFADFLTENYVKEKIENLIKACNANNEKELQLTSSKIIQILDKCNISELVQNEILESYKKLNCKYVAVRSSATSEDGKNHAWAGQLESFLNVNENNIIESVKKCWYSIFSPRAIFYRIKNNDKSDIAVAVVVQKMIQSEISGVAFSINPTNNEENEVVIEAVLGIGEAIVSGKVTPDIYIINKNENAIKNKKINTQKTKLIKIGEENQWVSIQDGHNQKLQDNKIMELAKVIKNIEEFYGFPVDIEWAIENEELYIVQCRPITTVKDNNITEKIKKTGNWKFYVSRKFNWFVENTEIYASIAKYQEDVLGFELATQNYLCLNGDEYALESDFSIWCRKLNKYFEEDISFFEKFAKVEMEIVEEIKEYINYLEMKNLNNLSLKELAEEMRKFNELYIKSFIPGMTRPEDYLTYALEKELANLSFDKKDIDYIFLKISTCPNYFPMSYSEEPLDLLNIAKKARNKENIDRLIDEHIKKYAWIKGPVEFEDTAFTKEDYLQRLDNLVNVNIEEKINNILQVRKRDEMEYEKVLEQFEFSVKAKKLIEAIRNFIFLRTYTTEYSDHLFFVARHSIFEEISARVDINKQDLIMLDDKEILRILDSNKNTDIIEQTKKTIENRKKGFAMIWINGEVQTVFGDESIEIQNEIAKRFKITSENEQHSEEDVIVGNIANKGKVKGIARVLLNYQDIYKVKSGDIIVATMTTPDYISAMEKAAGFITDEGGITCHAAILSREFNVPCIVGTVNATKEIKDGELIELDAYSGKIYKVNNYKGLENYSTDEKNNI